MQQCIAVLKLLRSARRISLDGFMDRLDESSDERIAGIDLTSLAGFLAQAILEQDSALKSCPAVKDLVSLISVAK